MYFILAVLFLVFLLVLYLRKDYGYLERMGVPVVGPNFVFGSGPYLFHKHMIKDIDMERFKKHGKVWGVYQMGTPWLFVSDVEMLKRIEVQDFDSFSDHTFLDIPQKYRHVETANGVEWREMRKAMSPMFTTGKIKGMLKYMGDTVDYMVEYLDDRVKGQTVVLDMKAIFQATTMDIIAKCCFATETNCFADPNNVLFVMAKGFFDEFTAFDTPTALFMNFFMQFEFLVNFIDLTPTSFKNLWNITKKVQTHREQSGEKVGDFIDRIIEVIQQKRRGTDFQSVTEDQITSNGISFIANGFETSAATLGSLTYQLVHHPEAMDAVVAEVDDVLDQHDGVVNEDTVAVMPVLEASIKETLRICSPVTRFERLCTKDWTYGSLTIPKGTRVMIPYHVIHHNPEYWPEPEQFKPERFFKENAANIVQGSFQAFGAGPRACVGERFAMVEMKIVMVKLLSKFRLEKDAQTRMNLRNGEIFMNTYSDMFVKVSRRY